MTPVLAAIATVLIPAFIAYGIIPSVGGWMLVGTNLESVE